MKTRISLACSALALGIGLSLAPAAQAAETGDGMSKMSGAMSHKTAMKKHKKHSDSMMKGDAMSGDAMKSDEAPAK